MIWLWVGTIAFVAGTVYGAWHGSQIVSHPPKMLRMEIWPDRYNLPFETVKFRTSDGLTLTGWFIPAQSPTDRTILFCHGWGDNKGDLLQHTYFLYRDFNLFFVDFRQHGESEGSRSSLGCLESRDIEAALTYLSDARPEWRRNLGIYGHSMGAAVAIWAAGRYSDIKAVAAESPFASADEVVTQFVVNEYYLPYFPFAWLTNIVIRKRLRADPEPFSPIYHVDRIAPRPVLVITGEQDRLMPVKAVRRLYEKAGNPKELWVIPGAGHRDCETIGGAQYHRRLNDFFLKHL